MTEDEAKTKWCPFTRQSEQGVGGSYNRPTDGGFNCIGSACMAWRGTTFYNASGEYQSGHCGLAGKP